MELNNIIFQYQFQVYYSKCPLSTKYPFSTSGR